MIRGTGNACYMGSVIACTLKEKCLKCHVDSKSQQAKSHSRFVSMVADGVLCCRCALRV